MLWRNSAEFKALSENDLKKERPLEWAFVIDHNRNKENEGVLIFNNITYYVSAWTLAESFARVGDWGRWEKMCPS